MVTEPRASASGNEKSFFSGFLVRWSAAGVMLAEWIYRAITQTLGETEPEWHGAVAAMLLPVDSHTPGDLFGRELVKLQNNFL